jgi:hypothetical protein
MAWIKLFNREVKLRPFVLSSTLRKIRGKWRDGKYTGRIVITGKVEITNGPKHAGPYRNHFVRNALQALMYILLTNTYNYSGSSVYCLVNFAPLNPQTMYLGSDTSTKTTASMTALVAPIGTAPGTAPNGWNSSIQMLSNGSAVTYTATWNAGTVSGTIGEMALYGSVATNYYTGMLTCGNTISWGGGSVMLSRLSVADGDFSAFAINASYPLIIVWTIQFLFA